MDWRWALGTGWLLLALAAGGCPHGPPPGGGTADVAEPAGAESPEALLAQVQEVRAANDYARLYGLLTRESRRGLLAGALLAANLTTLDGQTADPAREAALNAILERHGIRTGPDAGGDADATLEPGEPPEEAPRGPRASLAPQVEDVTDPGRLVADLIAFVQQQNPALLAERVTGSEGLSVDGERGVATLLVTTAEGETKQQAVELHRVEGRWFLHTPEEAPPTSGGDR